jgi:hypothetical protein
MHIYFHSNSSILKCYFSEITLYHFYVYDSRVLCARQDTTSTFVAGAKKDATVHAK